MHQPSGSNMLTVAFTSCKELLTIIHDLDVDTCVVLMVISGKHHQTGMIANVSGIMRKYVDVRERISKFQIRYPRAIRTNVRVGKMWELLTLRFNRCLRDFRKLARGSICWFEPDNFSLFVNKCRVDLHHEYIFRWVGNEFINNYDDHPELCMSNLEKLVELGFKLSGFDDGHQDIMSKVLSTWYTNITVDSPSVGRYVNWLKWLEENGYSHVNTTMYDNLKHVLDTVPLVDVSHVGNTQLFAFLEWICDHTVWDWYCEGIPTIDDLVLNILVKLHKSDTYIHIYEKIRVLCLPPDSYDDPASPDSLD